MKPRIISSPYPQPWTKNAVEFIVNASNQAIERRERFSLVLSGGGTPTPVYRALSEAENAGRIDWFRTHVFWGDERAVPPDHPNSNYGMAKQALLDHLPLPLEHIHRIPGELPPEEAAARYQQQIERYFEGQEQRFDIVLLGLGADGHTASLFPESEALSEEQLWVAANYAPSQQAWRITLTYPAILSARQILFLVSGAGKAEVVKQIIQQPDLAAHFPTARIASQHQELTWILDEDAARNL
jgi:6-phosphogluconolactonase